MGTVDPFKPMPIPLLQSAPVPISPGGFLHQNASNKQLLPRLSECSANRGEYTEDSRDENGSTAAEVVIAGVTDPAANECTPDVGTRVDEANKQVMVPSIGTAFCITFTNSELDWKGQVCTIGPGLIPIHCV